MPHSCKTMSECDKIVNPWTNMKNIDWREIFLATGLVALTSPIPPTPTKMAITGSRLLHARLCYSRGAALLPGLCSPIKVYLLPSASQSPGHREPQGQLLCYFDRSTYRELWLPVSLAGDGRAHLSREVRPKPLIYTYSMAKLKSSFAIPVTSLSSSPSWDDIHLSPCQIPNCAAVKCISSRVLSA